MSPPAIDAKGASRRPGGSERKSLTPSRGLDYFALVVPWVIAPEEYVIGLNSQENAGGFFIFADDSDYFLTGE
jgi:hypothetical protein